MQKNERLLESVLPQNLEAEAAVLGSMIQDREVIGEIDDGCAEAGRCISCGSCTGCDNCFIYCPEPAVTRSDGVYVFDLDYCKGCGVCLTECPRGAIDMVEEG